MQLARAPRFVPLPVRLQMLLGGGLSQIGWFFMWFGTIFFWIFCWDGLVSLKEFSFAPPLKAVQGVIREADDIGMEINEVDVMGHLVDYEVAGQRYETMSFTTGKLTQAGTSVTVFYRPDKPWVARIEDMRAAPIEGWPIFLVLIFPGLGILMVIGGLRKGLQAVSLIQHGELTQAKLIKREHTQMQVNDQTVWKLIFSYQVKGKMYDQSLKTHQTEKLTDESQEALIYHPKRPAQSLLLDSLPGELAISSSGLIVTASPWLSLLLLIQPAIAAAVIVIGWQLKSSGAGF